MTMQVICLSSAAFATSAPRRSKMATRGALQTDAVAYRHSDFRKVMKELDDDLLKRDVLALKFLCSDHLPVSKQEKIHRGIDLFNELERRGIISEGNLKFFAELLYHIGRYDLLKKVGFSHRDVKQRLDTKGSQLSAYRVMLHKISEQLTSSDVDMMKFVNPSDFSRVKLESIHSPTELFLALEHMERLDEDNVSVLREMLEAVDKEVVLQQVIKYQDQHGRAGTTYSSLSSSTTNSDDTSLGDLHLSLKHANISSAQEESVKSSLKTEKSTDRRPSSEQRSNTHRPVASEHAMPVHGQPMYIMPYPTSPQEMPQGHYYCPYPAPIVVRNVIGNVYPPHEANPDFYQQPQYVYREEGGDGRQRVNEGRGAASERMEDRSPCYSMQRRPRGVCLIINNHTFYCDPNDPASRSMPNRDGTEVDAMKLDRVFRSMNFNVDTCVNLTDEGLNRKMMEYAVRRDHSRYDCFVCCILTHGTEGSVYGTNGKKVPIKDLLNLYRGSCAETLKGKPKLFFIQACQGKEKQTAVEIETDSPTVHDAISNETIPNEADFLLGYASLPGYVSFRSKKEGSWYITTLVKILERYHKTEDLVSMLTRVNQEVSRATAFKEYKQCPAPLFTLRKKVYFR